MTGRDEIEIDESCCSRCKELNPEASTGSIPSDWEIKGEGLICAGCMTGEDWKAIDKQEREIEEEAQAWLRAHPND